MKIQWQICYPIGVTYFHTPRLVSVLFPKRSFLKYVGQSFFCWVLKLKKKMIGKSRLTLVTKFDLTTVTKQNSAFKEFFLIQGLFFHSSNPELLALVFRKQHPVVLQKSYFFYWTVLFFIFLCFQEIFI